LLPGKIQPGIEIQLSGVVKKSGKDLDANVLENYLGAKAHIVAISMEGKKYVHLHPVVKNGRFEIHGNLPDPGTYRWWVQFMAGGELHTIDLTTKVASR
jgi:hypothetical protein